MHAVCAGRRLIDLDGPDTGALAANERQQAVTRAVADVMNGGGDALLVTDIDALLPTPAEPVRADDPRRIEEGGSGHPGGLIAHLPGARCGGSAAAHRPLRPRTRAGLPDGATREHCWRCCCTDLPAKDLNLSEIADRTPPGFVRADLAALVREAALRAAAQASEDGKAPELIQEDFKGSLTVIRPLSRSNTGWPSVRSPSRTSATWSRPSRR